VAGGDAPDVPRMNEIISEQIDRLTVVLAELQNEIF
jgi:hypothetical protein